MSSACVRAFVQASEFCHLCSLEDLKNRVHSYSLQQNMTAFLLLVVSTSAAQKCFGILGCHHVALMWFLSGFTRIIINNKLVNMSRQCKQSGELGAAVVKQNTAVLLSTWAYEHNIAKSCLRDAWWTQICRWLRISHTSGQKENYSGCTEAHSFIHSFLIFIILVLIFILLFYTFYTFNLFLTY